MFRFLGVLFVVLAACLALPAVGNCQTSYSSVTAVSGGSTGSYAVSKSSSVSVRSGGSSGTYGSRKASRLTKKIDRSVRKLASYGSSGG